VSQHADRALDLLEVLWERQHQYGKKYDWRQVQIQMGIQVYVDWVLAVECLQVHLQALMWCMTDLSWLKVIIMRRTTESGVMIRLHCS
jgi:hypothetical protein